MIIVKIIATIALLLCLAILIEKNKQKVDKYYTASVIFLSLMAFTLIFNISTDPSILEDFQKTEKIEAGEDSESNTPTMIESFDFSKLVESCYVDGKASDSITLFKNDDLVISNIECEYVDGTTVIEILEN